ncbi:MAG: RlmE family RNA methyltransferase [Alphaproteobacteria bacterium]|nr:RlmE family RNA methyltransferase [Alphaproteobacteria bacterium]
MSKAKKRRPEARTLTEKVKTAKGRKASSTKWLQRQLNDPFVQEAKRLGYRGRAAFKLIQLDDKFRFLKPGARVVDLGAAPGGWAQVAVQRVKAARPNAGRRRGTGGREGLVIGLDWKDVDPLDGAIFLKGDFMTETGAAMVRAALAGPADVVLSDLASDATGHAPTDHLRIIALAEAAVAFACEVLTLGGTVIIKVLQGADEPALFEILRRNFTNVRRIKPAASRTDSAELYLVGMGFRGEGGI